MYRKNVSQVVDFAMVTTAGAGDGAATVNAKRFLDGVQGSATGNIINQGGGAYSLVMASADCNGDSVGLFLTATGDVPLMIGFRTTAANPQNAASFGLTNLDSTVSSRYGAGDPRLLNLDSTISSRYGAGDPRLSNLDSTISSRMGIFTLPTNFQFFGIDASGNISGNVNGNVLGSVQGNIGGFVFLLGTGAVSAAAIAAAAATKIADSQFDQANGIETGLTMRQSHRIQSAAAAGQTSGMGTTAGFIFPAVAGGATARILATMDSFGNRSGLTYNL